MKIFKRNLKIKPKFYGSISASSINKALKFNIHIQPTFIELFKYETIPASKTPNISP